MNEWNAVRKLKTLLQAAVWPGTSTKVFDANSVRITVAPDTQALAHLASPLALIAPGAVQFDPQHGEEQSLVKAEVRIKLVVCVQGDEVGENALLGANLDTAYQSGNRGLLDVEEQLLSTVKTLNALDGEDFILQCTAASGVGAALDPELGYVAWREYVFEMWLNTDATPPAAGSI